MYPINNNASAMHTHSTTGTKTIALDFRFSMHRTFYHPAPISRKPNAQSSSLPCPSHSPPALRAHLPEGLKG